MNSNFSSSSRRAFKGYGPGTLLKSGIWLAWLAGLMTLTAFGTERTWTGSANAYWSNPINWSPVGTPLNGDDLEFLGNDSNDSMVNDIVGLSVTTLTFDENNYQLTGNPLTILSPTGTMNDQIGGYISNTGGGGSRTVTINCALTLSPGVLIFTGAGGDEYQLAFTTTIALILNGNIQIGGDVYFFSQTQVNGDTFFPFGDEDYYDGGTLEISGAISGTGGIHARTDEYSSLTLDGAAGNTFAGILEIYGGGTCTFNKQSGLAVPNDLNIHNAEEVQLEHAEQIADTSTVSLSDGSEFLLNGYNETIGDLVLTNVSADALPSLVDTAGGPGVGPGTLTLNGIAAYCDNDTVHPTVRGIVNLPGSVTFSVGAGSTPGLEIVAVVEGIGALYKGGPGFLLLDATNTFTDGLLIDAGTVQPAIPAALSPSGAGVYLGNGNLQIQGLAIGAEPLYVDSTNGTFIAYDSCSWAGPVTLNANFNVLPADTTLTGKTMDFGGSITGPGGINFLDSPSYNGTLILSGALANTFSGAVNVYGRLLELDKPYEIEAFGGSLIVGGGTAAVSETRWLNGYQHTGATLTLYANGLVNLNNFNEAFDTVTFNGGTVETGTGQFAIYQPLTVNASGSTATIDGNFGLPSGQNATFIVNQGSTLTGIDLLVNAAVSGTAPYFVKQGAGTMSLAGASTFSGATLLQAGILAMDNATALSTHAVIISGGATLKLDVSATLNQGFELYGDGTTGLNGVLDVASNVSVTMNGTILLDAESTFNVGQASGLVISGVIFGTGPLTEIGPGELELAGSSANTYTGDTFANQGILVLDKSDGIIAVPGNLTIGTKSSPFNNLGTTATLEFVESGAIGGTTVTINGGSLWELESHNQTLANVILNNGCTIFTGNGILTLNGANSSTVLAVNPGKSGASVIAGSLKLANGGNIAVGGRQEALFGSGPELDLQAILSDGIAYGITKSGNGEMRLSAINTFLSPMTVNAGKLTLSNSYALGISSSTTINSNGTLVLEGSILIQNNALTLNSSASPAWQSLNGANIWNYFVTLDQTAAIDVEPANGYLTIQDEGQVSGPGGLTAIGSGTLDFEGNIANTYTGLTTVSNGVVQGGRFTTAVTRNKKGVLVTNEVAVTSFPGDVVIGSDATSNTVATLRSLREEQLVPTANVAIHLSGLLDLPEAAGQKDPSTEELATLTGSGLVNLGLSATLFMGNNGPCTFYGNINGAGNITKQGSGTWTTYGNINNTGIIQLLDGGWELFGALNNSSLLVANDGESPVRLGGDGVVAGAVNIVEATLGVDSHFPDHQGSILTLGTLFNFSGVTIQLDLFGSSPTGGNDQIVTTSGGVVLTNDTILAANFNYPPRQGDVLDLIKVPSGQTITGNFANFADGVGTLAGTTPVLPSYEGGSSGHDFTLTVTNLALAYDGYQLAEGNGNQTVEPNECNLLYVSLVNRRINSLTITNAYLRATNTTGVLVTIPMATYPVIAAGHTMQNLTPFQFSTDTNLPCGGAVGFELVVSVINEGQFAIDFSPVSGSDCTHPTGPCDSCTVVSGVFTTNDAVDTQPLYFVGAPSIAFPPKAYPGTNPAPSLVSAPYLTHCFTNSTTNLLCLTAQLEFSCPAAPTNTLGVAAYLGTFDPNNPSVGYLGDIGSGGPPYPPFSFQVPPGTNFTLVVMAQATNLVCNNYSLQLYGLPCAPPTLAITNDIAPAALKVNWSTAYPGFTAQQSSKLNAGTFTNVTQSPVILNSRYSLTNIYAGTNQFYRLKK